MGREKKWARWSNKIGRQASDWTILSVGEPDKIRYCGKFSVQDTMESFPARFTFVPLDRSFRREMHREERCLITLLSKGKSECRRLSIG